MALSIPHPKLLKTILSYSELYDWFVFDQVEGIQSEYRNDKRTALAVANLLSPHLKKNANINPEDFLTNKRNRADHMFLKTTPESDVADKIKTAFLTLGAKKENKK